MPSAQLCVVLGVVAAAVIFQAPATDAINSQSFRALASHRTDVRAQTQGRWTVKTTWKRRPYNPRIDSARPCGTTSGCIEIRGQDLCCLSDSYSGNNVSPSKPATITVDGGKYECVSGENGDTFLTCDLRGVYYDKVAGKKIKLTFGGRTSNEVVLEKPLLPSITRAKFTRLGKRSGNRYLVVEGRNLRGSGTLSYSPKIVIDDPGMSCKWLSDGNSYYNPIPGYRANPWRFMCELKGVWSEEDLRGKTITLCTYIDGVCGNSYKMPYKCPGGSAPDEHGKCHPCPPGTFDEHEGWKCTPCYVGSYSDKESMYHCLPCPEGTFAATEGMSQCTKCPAGTVTYFEPNTVPVRHRCVEDPAHRPKPFDAWVGQGEPVKADGRGYYLKLGDGKLDRKAVRVAYEAASKPVKELGTAAAEALVPVITDAKRETEVEMATVNWLLANYRWTRGATALIRKAEASLRPKPRPFAAWTGAQDEPPNPHEGPGGSYYYILNAKGQRQKFDRKALRSVYDVSKNPKTGGTLQADHAELLGKRITDGGRITDVEIQTVHWLKNNYRWSEDARAALDDLLLRLENDKQEEDEEEGRPKDKRQGKPPKQNGKPPKPKQK